MNNLEVCEFNKKILGKSILENINLKFQSGNIYGLIGPNGSGKTTLMKCIYNLYKGNSGKIVYNGEKITSKLREKIAFMPTEDYLYLEYTACEIINFTSKMYQDFNKSKVYDIAKKLNLPVKEKIKNYSTGMKMRLKLAICLGRKADVYMLDEPLNGIDLISRDLIKETILSHYSDESILIISDHMIAELETILDNVILIKNGKIVFQENLEELRIKKNLSLEDIYREVYRD